MKEKTKCAEAQMLIRKSPEIVFEAFINPNITKHFWFTNGSAKLDVGKEVIWTWNMYNFSAKVIATEIIPSRKLSFDWYGQGKPTSVSIDFKEVVDIGTYVSIVHRGFDVTGDELIEVLKDSAGGFAMVLAGLKCYLEHGFNLNLIGDKSPKIIKT